MLFLVAAEWFSPVEVFGRRLLNLLKDEVRLISD